MCSSPTEMRTMSGCTPAAACCSALSWRCVVLAGWLMSVRVSPMLTRWLMNCAASMKRTPASALGVDPPLLPPLTPNASNPDAPRICRIKSACCGWSGRPG